MKRKFVTTVTAVTFAVSVFPMPVVLGSEVMNTTEMIKKAQRPEYKTRADIPARYKWNLEDIYISKEAWTADLKKLERMANAFPAHQGKLAESYAVFLKALNDLSDLMRLRDKVYVYASMGFDVNASNSSLKELFDKAEKASVLVSEKTSWFTPEVLAIPPNKRKAYLAKKEVAPYKPFLEDLERIKPHTLNKETEALLAQFSPLGQNPENVYSLLSKDVKFPKIKDENGKEVQLTRANFTAYMESKNRNVRKAAFEAYYRTLEEYQDTFAQVLSGKVKANNTYAKVRKYRNALEASLTPNNVPVKVYDQLIQSVNKGLPLLHRYMELKKRMLGVKELHMYDIYTPIVEANSSYIPYEEAQQRVLEGLKPLGEEYGKVLSKAFTSGWIDVYSTADKRSGAYQSGAYDTHPYVLLNYQGTTDDIFTIAHELGHAMHTYYTNRTQPYITANYPIFTAEVASTLNEALLFESMYAKAKTKQEKIYLLNQRLENFRTTLFRQTQFAEFEKLIHEKEQAGESLNAEALKKMYIDINKKYYGAAMVNDKEIAMEWGRIPHFYYNFYVYQYATSFAASTALAEQVLKEGRPAVDRIREKFLSAGNSKAPIEILREAGVDVSTSKPIDDALKVFAETLNELEKLISQK
ncbi:oligoendopeptidase F [Aneurinibacillus thermoaerophilus]|uniref:Oligopeptidase F n=1 Tax=Aneurinibacillus thermoaerophilus TaxID=143495 RepID=A0A1G7X7N5_ANETH|nr:MULTISPECIES: oligoendopeptidase F [Aneurinibacillus]AMA73240.1 oligoendopeptidase F [Aneurinibacillus sp. XH2]MED0756971.1 oligoendopeptidase F [Aneurinibacillus thermoaerophilus]MED0761724.1 oligoendopeptidase F [Aneurinibacillus thermoaerophilus]SDG80137.1 oligopeptidase F. Metallo peptidase. MEROPS family M03B [Aneurinibacillus thermoaerophilus]